MTLFSHLTEVGQTALGRIRKVGRPVVATLLRPSVGRLSRDRTSVAPRSVEVVEEACRRGEDLPGSIVDGSEAVVHLKDPAGRYQLINRYWADLFGFTQESVVGKTDHDLFPVDIADGLRANDLKIMAEGHAVEMEEFALRDDGLHTYLSIKVPVLGANGVPIAICGIATDITERKRMEEALRLGEEQFRGSFESAAIGIGLADPEGQWLRVNPALCGIVGYSEQELLALTVQEVTHPDDLPAAIEMMSKTLAGEIGSFQTEKRFLHKNGQVLWVRLSVSVVRNLAGRPLHFVAQIEDVTPRRRAEDLAGALHDELQEAYDATIAGWARALDLRDHEIEGHSRRVTELTLQVARVLGMSEADLVHVRRGALLHDIGKIGVPDAILLKPGPLTEEERLVMRRHPDLAAQMLEPIAFLRPALDIPYCHHEKWDGTGYPRGLVGDEIPLAARIFAVVDVWDALRHDRPYRPAWPEDRVRGYLQSLAGTHLDSEVVAAFLDRTRPDSEPSETEDSASEPATAAHPAGDESQPQPLPHAVNPLKDPARLAALAKTGLMDSPADLPSTVWFCSQAR